MKKEDYMHGLGNYNSFCNWMENHLSEYGLLKCGNSSSFGIWNGKSRFNSRNGFQCVAKYTLVPFDIDKSFELLRKDLYDLLVAGQYEDFDKIDKNSLSDNYKSKILSIYFPEKYFCVFSREHIINIKNLLEIELSDEDSIWVIKRSIMEWQKENLPNLNIWSFMRAIYKEFDSVIRKAPVLPSKNLLLCSLDYISTIKPRVIVGSKGIPDFLEKQRRQTKVGRIGEDLVFEYEVKKLKGTSYKPKAYYKNDLSKHYDILSYNKSNGREIHIEVKTKVRFNNALDFYLTDHEYRQLMTDTKYAIYYVTDINTTPKLFILDISKIRKSPPEIELVPVSYRVQHSVKMR